MVRKHIWSTFILTLLCRSGGSSLSEHKYSRDQHILIFHQYAKTLFIKKIQNSL